MDNETSDRKGIIESMNSVHMGNHQNLVNSDDHNVSEIVIVIRSVEEQEVGFDENKNFVPNGNSNATVTELGSCKECEKKIEDLKEENQTCVIDVNGKLGENCELERVCRICHLSPDPSLESEPPPPRSANTMTTATCGLIELGCGCKDDLGIVHAYCAEAWFKLKRNRQCEICGETAKNITGLGDNRCTEDNNDTRFSGSARNFSDAGGRCLQGQTFCNFLMACLVIAFVLPWFFRVNMF